ncbi:DUF1176 domain-containing protein [Pseudoduganella dura]|nr:DUF1176 domain-containing protein [Pseudoduganella dura]GGY15126.1 hypothetical protein GCM10007386_51500 [Pseudoduganella dura]
MTIPALLRNASLAVALLAPLFCAAQEYEDWIVQCDNINHCEAVGYGQDSETAQWIAFQVMRDAGPATAVSAKFILAEDGPEKPAAITMTVDGYRPVPIQANGPIPHEAAHELLDRMIDGKAGQASDGRQRWTLPLAGMKAALLRMDALQGRIGTPGALVRRGSRPETSVPPAPAMPVLRAAPRAQSIHDRKIKAALLAEIHPGEEDTGFHGLYRLADGRLLYLLELGRGPMDSFHEIWLANGQPPYRPRELQPPTNGLPADALINADFDGQVLESNIGRGFAGCLHSTKWLWTGDSFELLMMNHADHCRGMLGLIEHRKWVARKVP